jgi:ADP-heptose:LPS heptosyltransferase
VRRLLIRPGAIGDFIVSLPALEHLCADYTEVWTTSANAPLVRFTDRVESITAVGLDALEPGPSVLQRLASFDSIVSWYGANRPEFRDAVSGLPFTFHRALPEEGAALHAVDYYLAQVGALPGRRPTLPLPRRDEGFVAIHPFSGSPRKNWPLSRFRELAARLECPVEWTAGPEETLPGARRFENLWDLAQWLATVTLFIGNDSGVSHLAAACGLPVIALFGTTDPRVWAPRGPHTQIIQAPGGVMDAIAVETVLATFSSTRRRL